ncbi:FAD-dependent oxidoreductase [Cohnella kolymensis]|uniref:FAD-dependent oxidoreductase n=1 Tax=Cohnella kolymensis TaxID=1590652 RepID=A0ABR5A7U9_9BACL|nr:L-2-hydroxyglutarate oxidase [Cohnella kolymensis]KIL36982.1 FAD-dependent oxidoreductase [Cohnella kolymensis]
MKHYDYLVIGAGIMGLTTARELKSRFPHKKVALLEKESDIAMHASGRNSGVLHAGFYYTADSLKAKFTKLGNQALTQYCENQNLKINKCGKLVIAANEQELNGLQLLKQRADLNGVPLLWVDETEIKSIDPNASTYQKALFSPTTSTIDPLEVCHALKNENARNGVEFHFNTLYKGHDKDVIITNRELLQASCVINAAGLYADKIAHDYGFGTKYTIIPFKGMYLKYEKNKTDVVTNIYPVPDLRTPFLGVHFTKTVDGGIKIGPTAIPALWREHYSGMKNFNFLEFITILFYEAKLFLNHSSHFRRIASDEIKKYKKSNFISLSRKLIRKIDEEGFGEFMRPGIRAQLLNKETLELVQDFVVEGDHRSMHILNAVSPAFTCSIPFAEHVVDSVIQKQGGRLTADE